MKGEILVLRISRYRITDEQTGELVEGCKIWYCNGLHGVEKQNSCGIDLVSGTMPYSAFAEVKEVPGYYMADFGMRATGKGQAMLVPQRLEFIRPLLDGKTGKAIIV